MKNPSKKARSISAGSLGFLCLASAAVAVSCTSESPRHRAQVQPPKHEDASVPKEEFDPSRITEGTEFQNSVSADSRQGNSVAGGGQIPASYEQAEGDQKSETPQYDKNFCKGLPDSSCFTLIIQVPKRSLAQSAGIAVLNLAKASPAYNGIFQRSCDEGLRVGWQHLLQDTGVGFIHKQGTWKKSFPNILKQRCIFQQIDNESQVPVELAQNETGVAVRLVDFGLESSSTSTAPAFGKFTFEKSRMTISFRDPMYFARTATGQPRQWLNLAGYDYFKPLNQSGIFPTATRKVAMKQSLTFDFNLIGSSRYAESVFQPVFESALQGDGLGELGLQLAFIKKQIKLLASSGGKVVPTVILMGIGIDAIRDLCVREESNCQLQNSQKNMLSVIQENLGGQDPIPAATKATFIDSTKYVPFAIVTGIIEGMDKKLFVEKKTH